MALPPLPAPRRARNVQNTLDPLLNFEWRMAREYVNGVPSGAWPSDEEYSSSDTESIHSTSHELIPIPPDAVPTQLQGYEGLHPSDSEAQAQQDETDYLEFEFEQREYAYNHNLPMSRIRVWNPVPVRPTMRSQHFDPDFDQLLTLIRGFAGLDVTRIAFQSNNIIDHLLEGELATAIITMR
jgi:hypothetical protein